MIWSMFRYSVDGKSLPEQYNLNCTNLQFIQQLIVSSENVNVNTAPSFQLKTIQGENDSIICYVGTHALNVSEEKLQEIDDRLSSVASELDHLHRRSVWSSPKEQLRKTISS